MSKRVSRVWTSVVIVAVAAAAGALAGYVVALGVTLNVSQHSLRRYAQDHAIDFERSPNEAHKVLAQMNASKDPFCSEAELTSDRRILMNSLYVKDIGRMRGDRLACSATFSRQDLPKGEYKSDFPGRDGSWVYIKMTSLRVGELTPIVIRLGDSYAALDPYSRSSLPSAMQFTLTMKKTAAGQSNYLGGNRTSLPTEVLTRDTDGRVDGDLYATRCSTLYTSCLTFYLPVRAAVREQHRQVVIGTLLGTGIGACFSLICIFLYRRTKGIEQQLRRAIRKQALRVVYQPLVDLTTRQVVGAEALMRWTDDDKLVIPPDVFIKIAEGRGFVNQITRLVVHRVLADFGRYLSEHTEFHINVNVAASDLTDPEFLVMLDEALAEAQVAPRSIGIEITEGGTARHTAAIQAIAALRARGHQVSVDDFGTGYSSLAYLKDLAVDGIKIDRAFTQAIGTESVTVSILPQILAMAETLKLGVVAEGVETETQAAFYAAAPFPLIAQGWLFGRPVPPEEFRQRWLQTPTEIVTESELGRRLPARKRTVFSTT